MRKVQTTEELMADLKERTASEIEELRRVAKNATKENPLSHLTRYACISICVYIPFNT